MNNEYPKLKMEYEKLEDDLSEIVKKQRQIEDKMKIIKLKDIKLLINKANWKFRYSDNCYYLDEIMNSDSSMDRNSIHNKMLDCSKWEHDSFKFDNDCELHFSDGEIYIVSDNFESLIKLIEDFNLNVNLKDLYPTRDGLLKNYLIIDTYIRRLENKI